MWRPDDIDDAIDTEQPFGDALAELAVDTEADIDPVAAVRESGEEIWVSSSILTRKEWLITKQPAEVTDATVSEVRDALNGYLQT